MLEFTYNTADNHDGAIYNEITQNTIMYFSSTEINIGSNTARVAGNFSMLIYQNGVIALV